jgi:hypothetical protein
MAKQASVRTPRSRVTARRDSGSDRSTDRDDRRFREDVQEVWDSSRDIWDGGCRVLSSFIIGIGEALGPPTYTRRRVEREYDDGNEQVRTTTETIARREESTD